MTLEKYFERTGKIYGVSSKFDFGEWHHRLAEFDSLEEAYKWLNTEEGDFRTREIGSKTHIAKIAGITPQKLDEELKPYFMR